MPMLSITAKDLRQSSRTLSAYFFMFVMPILVTLLFFVMFGGIGGESDEFELPRTTVAIVNLDEGKLPEGISFDSLSIPASGETSSELDFGTAENMGDVLTILLQDESFKDIMSVVETADEKTARKAVDDQELGVAILIPADFTDAMTGLADSATIELYRDPSLTFGPGIVEAILRQILDGFLAGRIAIVLALEQLSEAGIDINPELIQEQYEAASTTRDGQGLMSFDDPAALVEVKLPAGMEESTDLITQIVSVILAGMMVFFTFFTGSATMESILVEEERGTLARLFTTPNSIRTILGGKAFAVLITLVVQVSVLLLFGRLIFKIDWGDAAAVSLAALGLVIIAAATGVFLVSFLKNTRQSGIVFGGILTLTGMLGLIPVFTAGVPGQSQAIRTVSLLVPQGWAIRGFVTALEGGSVAEVLPYTAVLLFLSVIFVYIGQRRLQNRFA